LIASASSRLETRAETVTKAVSTESSRMLSIAQAMVLVMDICGLRKGYSVCLARVNY
jgi:hypothetical protein